MAIEHSILCPLCGNKVPPGLTRCPVCATDLQRVVAKLNGEARGSPEFMSEELPKVGLPRAKSLCPQCGLDLAGGENKCPRCGVPLSTEEAMIECPECGALSPKDSKSCQSCGNNLSEPQVPRPPRPVAPPVPPPIPFVTTPVPAPKPPKVEPYAEPEPGIVSEKVTAPPAPALRAEPARPREASMLTAAETRESGQGLVNGRGAINGTGLVNGNGITNGTRAEAGAPRSASKRRVVTRWQFLALLIALIVIIPTFMYLSYPRDSGPITIDGEFDDWSSIAKFGMHQNSASDSTNITGWTVETDSTEFYLYLATRVSTMSSSAIDSFYAFIDSDADAATGYLVAGMGADYLVKVIGWNDSVTSSSVSRFMPSSGDRRDWNGWLESGSAQARLAGDELEVAANIPDLRSAARYVLASQTGESPQGLSYVIEEDTPILIVHQEPSASLADGVISMSPSSPAMVVSLSCQGGSGTVTGLNPLVSGANSIQVQTGSIDLSPGETQTLTVNVDTSGSTTGAVISASVPLSGITSSFDSVTITGDPVMAYVASAPSTIVIDGAFGDWVGLTTPDTDATEVKDPNIDISSVGAVNTTTSSSFYVSVVGEVCQGSFVPSQLTKPSGSGGGSVNPAKKVGEDILRIYIDTDMLVSTGSVVIHPSKTIGADFLIEVRGLDGEIISRSIMEFVSGSWNYVGGTVTAAHDERQIELSVSSSSISMASSIDFIIEMTDWRAWSDLATAVPQGTRGTDGSDFGTRAWIVDNTIASSDATSTSNQRKLFYDGTNFWSVYLDGPNTIATYSTDGVSWTSVGAVFKTAGVVRTSIWYDSSSNYVYAVGDRNAVSVNVYVQRGLVSPSTHSITWTAADRLLAVSSNPSAAKNAYISKDASGYLWVMSTNATSATPSRYDLSVYRSSGPDSILGAWTFTGNMQTDIPQDRVKGCVVPAGSGSVVWAVYTYAGFVAARKHTGAWSAESILYTPTGLGSNTEEAPPSALVDARGVLHVVYGDDHEQPSGTSRPHILYSYNTGSAWSAAIPLSSTLNNNGFRYPTISLDTATGNVYAFWYDLQTQYVAAKRNVSGTWSTITLQPQTADVKQHLTSIYSAPSADFICYLWTQNTTATIQVVFDRIPQFSDAALPVIGMIGVLVFVISPMRRRKR